ncbi:hydrogenase nickel incorporation protein HypB [Accumulibacter sp.]|uniref:hydrogenase nickel incorporation protein HypB n=1 Tax=Accumulibacter sp. TaxID=2053492 RepID=UPI00262E86BA|nr:hydrogenase nickel incorporation protein HypB [Accumulibacter sp.]
MCTTCGCAVGKTRVALSALSEHENAPSGKVSHADPGLLAEQRGQARSAMSYRPVAGRDRQPLVTHGHDDAPAHRHPAAADFDQEAVGIDAPGMTASRMVRIERDILARNNGYAAENRRRFDAQGIFALNLVSSPGSGKTSLLCRTIDLLKTKVSIAVVEGDQQTSRDAERIRATGAAALQINTGRGCHLDAHMIGHALDELAPADDSLLLIENVGNLVCPAAFDLGEAHKVVILSVTEGEDKPLKYPGMFRAASLMLLNKIDLLPHLAFDSDLAVRYARQVNPVLQVIQLSAMSGEGFAEWLDWLMAGCAARQERRKDMAATQRRPAGGVEAPLAAGARG